MNEDDIEYDNDDDNTFHSTITTALTATCIVIQDHLDKAKHRLRKKKGRGRPFTIPRERMSILLIRRLLSDPYFKHSYCFSPQEIENLIQCIGPYVDVAPSGRTSAPNGIIPLETKVLATIRFLAGGSAYDIFPLFGIGHTSLFRCVWEVVQAINETPDMRIDFPHEHSKQRKIARGFQKKSTPRFNCCVGCIDGMLVWTEKPTEQNCAIMKCGPMRFMCGRKGKYGLNLQGVCDHIQRFISIWILHPGSSSDFLSFIRSSLYRSLQVPGYLFPGLVIFGDLAYVNNYYMVTPYKNVRAGDKDNFNFYHSQLRINIECAFGQLVHRWPILCRPLSANFGVKKQIALVHALCSLHNYCKNQRYNNDNSIMEWDDIVFPIPDGNGGMILPPATTTGTQIVSYDVTWRDNILDANEHFDDVEDAMTVLNSQRYTCVRTRLCDTVVQHNLRRPRPVS